MFDISWSEVLVVGVVALLVVGPKELPTLLRTVGKYVGLIKRQAAEFRAQFDEAMRESELDQLRKDVENIKTEAESTFRDAERSVGNEMAEAKREFDGATSLNGSTSHPDAHDANGLPFPLENSSSYNSTADKPAGAIGSGAGAGAMAAAAAASEAAALPVPAAKVGA